MKEKSIFFDSSTMICLAMTCSLPVLEKLHKDFNGKFYISHAVKAETVDKAAQTKRFKYEGYRLQRLINEEVFTLYDDSKYQDDINHLAQLANSTFYAKGRPVKIIHPGEVGMMIAAKKEGSSAIAVDERITRLLVEKPTDIEKLMGHRLHTHISTDHQKLKELRTIISGLIALRSIDLVTVAYKKGYLGEPNKDMLDGLLWALKLAGSAISSDEISYYVNQLA